MNWLFGNPVRGRGAIGLLIIRLVFGLGIMLHGWQKVHSDGGPMNWMPAGSPVPAILQGAATLAEFGGGIAIILGLLTPLAALGLTCNMLVALFMVHIPHGDPFVGQHSFEPAADYLAVAVTLLIAGPGCWSCDTLFLRPLFGQRDEAG